MDQQQEILVSYDYENQAGIISISETKETYFFSEDVYNQIDDLVKEEKLPFLDYNF